MSLNRHLQVLMLLSESSRPLSTQEITSAAHLPRATGYKLLEELEGEGWVIAEGSPRRYRPSLRVAHMGLLSLRANRARRVAVPHAIDCAMVLGKRCSVAFYEAGDVNYTDGFQRAGDKVVPYPLHSRVHCLTTASGRVLLAFQSEHEIVNVIEDNAMPRRSDGSESSAEQLLEELELIRVARFATANGEYDTRARGLAVPVFNEEGAVVAALGVDAPAGVTATFIESVLGPMRGAAGRASFELGHLGEDGLLS